LLSKAGAKCRADALATALIVKSQSGFGTLAETTITSWSMFATGGRRSAFFEAASSMEHTRLRLRNLDQIAHHWNEVSLRKRPRALQVTIDSSCSNTL
jgi:hypothetical protein